MTKQQPKVNGPIESYPFLTIDRLLSKEIATFMYNINNELLPKVFDFFFKLNQCNKGIQDLIA